MLEIIKIRKLGKGVKYSTNFKELIVEHIIITMPITILAQWLGRGEDGGGSGWIVGATIAMMSGKW